MPKIETSHTARIAEIRRELDAIDAKSVRAVRATAAGTVTDEDTRLLKTLEEQAGMLRAEMESLVL